MSMLTDTRVVEWKDNPEQDKERVYLHLTDDFAAVRDSVISLRKQHIPRGWEDKFDLNSYHLVAYQNTQAVACLRLTSAQDYPIPNVQFYNEKALAYVAPYYSSMSRFYMSTSSRLPHRAMVSMLQRAGELSLSLGSALDVSNCALRAASYYRRRGCIVDTHNTFIHPTDDTENCPAYLPACLDNVSFITPITLHGNKGDDTLYGGQGNDVVYGNDDSDLVYGNHGDDELWGDYGHDFIIGGAADTLFGGDGDDVVYGNEGDDVLYGDGDADTLYGGQDDDWLFGGSGADHLFGNLGSDSMEGGAGADIFHVHASDGDGVDYISDLTDDDKIRLAGADLNGTVVSGTTANANEVAVDSADGETTLYIDTDGIDGADVEAVLDGTYTADDFLADGTDIWFEEGVNPAPGGTRFEIEYAGWSSSSSLFSLVADDGRDLSEAYVTLSDGTRIDAIFDAVSGTWQIDFSGYGEHNPDYDPSVNIDPDNPDDPATMNGKGSMSWQDSVQFTLVDEDGNVQNIVEQLLISADRDIKADSEIYGGDGTDVAHLVLLRAYEGDGGETSRYGGGGGTRNLWTGNSEGDKIHLADEASNPEVISFGEWMIASVLNTHIEGQPGIETRVSLGVPGGISVTGELVLEDTTDDDSIGSLVFTDDDTGDVVGTVTFRDVNHFADPAGARLTLLYTGNDEDNAFDHYGGSDAFYGMGGNDTVWTDDANGSDYEVTLDGGEGEDMVLFRYVGKDFEFDMNQAADADGYQSLVVNNGDATVNTTFLMKDFEIFGDGNGDDTIIGNDEANIISSKISGGWVGGADSMLGGGGNDSILSGNGADTVHGDGGDDTLSGGGGTDWISGGAGNDMLAGGAGADVFYFEDNDSIGLDFGDDTITDFDASADSLDIVTTMTPAELQAAANQDGDNVVIDLGDGESITILDAEEADIDAILI